MLIDSIKMGFSDLKKRKFRTALTSFSIAIGTMLLIVMFGLGEGVQKNLDDQMKQFSNNKVITVVNQEPSKEAKTADGKNSREEGKYKKIDGAAVEAIKKIDGVKDVTAQIDSKLTKVIIENKTGKQVSLIGRDANYTIFSQATIDSVKSKHKSDYEPISAGKNLDKNDTNSVLIGQRYLEKMGITDIKSVIGKNIELVVELPNLEGEQAKEPLVIKSTITGVINKNYGNEGYQIVAPVALAAKIQEYYTGEKDYLNTKGYPTVTVACKDLTDVAKVNDNINKKLVYGTYANLDRSDSLGNAMAVIKGILIAAGVIVLLVSAIGVINTMTMIVYEKTKSIGIMKAQGASRKHINIMFLVQAGVLGFIGGIIGTILALIASLGLDHFVIGQLKSKGVSEIEKLFYTPLWAILMAIGFSILVCLIAGILPARRAAKLNPVDSLRYE